jgi:phage repressor protein C with HTH and peptisase S24 domain
MSPRLTPGKLVIAVGFFRSIRPGQVYVFRHDGREKIKRVERLANERVFFIGDNLSYSSDSRHFGWVPSSSVCAKVIWPRVHN